MNSIDNASILRDIHAAWNAKDMDKTASYARPDAKVTMPSGETVSFRDYIENWAKAFPDGKVDDARYLAQGNTVVAEFVGRGTHTGPLKGPMGEIAPTQRRMELKLAEIWEFSNGKLIGGRSYFDSASMMTQLGLMPAMPGQQAQRPAVTPRH